MGPRFRRLRTRGATEPRPCLLHPKVEADKKVCVPVESGGGPESTSLSKSNLASLNDAHSPIPEDLRQSLRKGAARPGGDRRGDRPRAGTGCKQGELDHRLDHRLDHEGARRQTFGGGLAAGSSRNSDESWKRVRRSHLEVKQVACQSSNARPWCDFCGLCSNLVPHGNSLVVSKQRVVPGAFASELGAG